ncbi:hypothetical protein IB75_03260 [Nitrosococcus oceani C-27]|uniref:Uncharacterized protein n=1 Tax=Nitrosococcus oceani C-27 TaxID=314279 RepID=A0A0E2Z3X4_9GAMM|nr:hypothetical protein IB75_03260 [Nitrosococcus oceani C-27]KFI23543.1 hypothetical protein HW44_03275 [Nitrosococcus oceani]
MGGGSWVAPGTFLLQRAFPRHRRWPLPPFRSLHRLTPPVRQFKMDFTMMPIALQGAYITAPIGRSFTRYLVTS